MEPQSQLTTNHTYPRPPIPAIINFRSNTSWVHMVEEFQEERCKNDLPLKPTLPSNQKLHTMVDFLFEEITEMRDAVEAQDIAGIVDGMVDMIYYAIGNALLMGVDLTPHFLEVHLANMEKEHNPNANPDTEKRVTKPPRWQAPRIQQILDAQEAEA